MTIAHPKVFQHARRHGAGGDPRTGDPGRPHETPARVRSPRWLEGAGELLFLATVAVLGLLAVLS